VKETKAAYDCNISSKMAGRYFRDDLISCSPLKRGPVGVFPKQIYSALKGAFSTFLKLEQAESKKQSTVKDLSKLINATVNKARHNKMRDDLTRKLKHDTADEFELGKVNTVEARQVYWTTLYNLNVWFDTFRETLVELGFGRLRLPDEVTKEESIILS
jgi:hypothetical protein